MPLWTRPLADWAYLPAIIQFAAFAWFELIYPAPDDPYRLAWVVALYWLVNFVAMLIVGHRRWTLTGECFSVFFGMISKLGIFQRTHDDRLSLGLPGAKLLDIAPLPASGVLFVLLALGSVSFDGLMRTFWWLGMIDVNPLEFPGRSAVILPDTLGLAAMAALLAAAFIICIRLGEKLSGAPVGLHLADQLMVPFAIAAARTGGECSFVTPPLSSHSTTNGAIVAAFLGRAPAIEARGAKAVRWSIR